MTEESNEPNEPNERMKRLTQKEQNALKELLINKEGGDVCPLCERSFQSLQERATERFSAGLSKTLSNPICLDHNHVTGQIRGLLCRNCNAMLGKIEGAMKRAGFNDDVQFLERTLEYLKGEHEPYLHSTFRTKEEISARKAKKAKAKKRKVETKSP